MFDYIYLKHKDGVFYAPATVAGSNFAPEKGELFCAYESVLEESALKDKTITSAGLAVGQSLDSCVEAQSVEHKKGGSKLIVSITLSLNCGGNCRFLSLGNGEDNALARNILSGISVVSGYEIAAAQDFLPADAIFFNQSAVLEKKSASAKTVAGALIVSSAAFSVPVREAVLFFENMPVLRVIPPHNPNVKLSTVTATAAGGVVLNEDYVIDAFDVSVDSAAVVAYFLSPCADTLSYYGESEYSVSANTVIKKGINGSNLLISGNQITLTEQLKPVKSFQGFDAKMTANGAVVVFDEYVSITDAGGEHKLSFKAGVKNEAVFSGGTYLIVCFDGGGLSIHRVNGSTFSVASTYQGYTGWVSLVDMFGCFVAAMSEGFNCAYTILGTESKITGWLDTISGYINTVDSPVFEQGRLTFFDGADSYYIAFLNYSCVSVVGRVSGDFTVTFDGGKSQIRHMDNPSLVLAQTDGKLTSLTYSDDRLRAVTADGRVITYLIGSKKTRLNCSAINSASKITCFLRYGMPAAGAVSISVSAK